MSIVFRVFAQVRVTHRDGRIYSVQGLSTQPATQIRFMNEEVNAEQSISVYFKSRSGALEPFSDCRFCAAVSEGELAHGA